MATVRCPHCNSKDVMETGEFDEDGEEFWCNACDDAFAIKPKDACPSCGSIYTEESEERDGYHYCTKCGMEFKLTRGGRSQLPVDRRAQQRLAFVEQAARLGLDPALLGKRLEYQGANYEISGVNTRARKCPFVIHEVGGTREIRCTAAWLLSQLHLPVPAAAQPDYAAIAAAELKKRGPRMGIAPELAGRVFLSGEERVRLLGLSARNRKMPVCLLRLSDGRYRKCTVEYFLGMLGTMLPLEPAAALPSAPVEAETVGSKDADATAGAVQASDAVPAPIAPATPPAVIPEAGAKAGGAPGQTGQPPMAAAEQLPLF